MPQSILHIAPVQAVCFEKRGAVYFADFGRAGLGNLQIAFLGEVAPTRIFVRLGEQLNADGTIHRICCRNFNFVAATLTTQFGQRIYQPEFGLEEGAFNCSRAIKTLPDIGNVMRFRFAEIEVENDLIALAPSSVRRTFVQPAFDNDICGFHHSILR